MNLMQLTVFREIMRSGSISQTARKLNRTQPAISMALKNLEASLGLQLFERRGHQLIPVPEAQYLVAEATVILDRLTTVSTSMKSLRNGQSGSLNVAAMPGPSAYLFPRYISDAIGQNPDIKVSLSSRSSQQIQTLAGTQSIDFGFGDFEPPQHNTPQYTAELIRADCFCAIPADHDLAKRKHIRIADLDGLPMGALQENHLMYRRTAEAFAKSDADFSVIITSQFFLPLFQFIGFGQCFAIVDPLSAATEREMNSTQGRVVFVPLAEPLRYDYTIMTPLHRPASQLATQVKAGWLDALITILDGLDANPTVLPKPF